MAYSAVWTLKEITIPAADMSLVSGNEYDLDMANFHKEIRRLEWEFTEGMAHDQVLDHTVAKLNFAGANYAPFDEIINGYQIKFDAGIERVNLKGSNNNLVDVLIVTGASLVPSNSAGLQLVAGGGGFTVDDRALLTSAELHSKYNGSVYYDPDSGVNGDGTRLSPFNILNDTVDFAEANNITHIRSFGDFVLTRQVKNFQVTGVGASLPTIDLNGQDVGNSRFYQTALEGSYLGVIIAQECVLKANMWLNGNFENCGISGKLYAIDGAGILIKNCSSLLAGAGQRPELDMNATGTCQVSVRGIQGGLTVYNCNQPTDAITVEMNPAAVTLDASCTDGDIAVRGVGYVVDNSNGSAVTNEALNVPLVAVAVWNYSLAALTNVATIGGFIAKKLLTFKKFIAG